MTCNRGGGGHTPFYPRRSRQVLERLELLLLWCWCWDGFQKSNDLLSHGAKFPLGWDPFPVIFVQCSQLSHSTVNFLWGGIKYSLSCLKTTKSLLPPQVFEQSMFLFLLLPSPVGPNYLFSTLLREVTACAIGYAGVGICQILIVSAILLLLERTGKDWRLGLTFYTIVDFPFPEEKKPFFPFLLILHRFFFGDA